MGQRPDLQALLEELTPHVYFQAPPNTQMQYPCIRYERTGADQKHADNKNYTYRWRYELIVIDRNPDSLIPAKLFNLALCEYQRHYVVDGLHHDVFDLYF